MEFYDKLHSSSVTNVPIETKQLTSVFKAYRNDIDIYTEDKQEDKEFYVKLFHRLLDGTGIRINDIYPLGCRNQVVKACKSNIDDTRKYLYIVDGDIYLQYKEKESHPHLFVLDAYCIENYMVCEKSIVNTAYTFDGTKSIDEIKEKLNYGELITSMSKPLIDLFYTFSIQHEVVGKFMLGNIHQFFDDMAGEIDQTKLYNYINDIKNRMILAGKISNERYMELLSERSSKNPYSESTLFKIVSGKDYIIPYFMKQIKRRLSARIELRRETWKFNFVDDCDISKLQDLKIAIISA